MGKERVREKVCKGLGGTELQRHVTGDSSDLDRGGGRKPQAAIRSYPTLCLLVSPVSRGSYHRGDKLHCPFYSQNMMQV